jgi:hypothetical protein
MGESLLTNDTTLIKITTFVHVILLTAIVLYLNTATAISATAADLTLFQ